ncbi:MAG: VWA domain-containing protein [Chthoniobacteraceae bacterium]|nr:VWA domain-containing protein [Chthoniobacteraceae bacterium]
MHLAAPEWLLLFPVLALAAWRWRALRAPLRVVCLVLLICFAARPQVQRHGRGLDVWVLADRSASAAESVGTHLAEWERILERSKGPDDRLFWVDYATEACLREVGESIGSAEATNTALAAKYALSQMPGDRASRLLALSDGFSTEPLEELAERLQRQGVALDYRLASEGLLRDFRVEELSAPARVRPNEPLLVELRVRGPGSEAVPFTLLRDDQPLAQGKVDVRGGRGVVRFTDRVAAPGGHRYSVRIAPERDAHPGNNTAERWVEVAGGPRVLLVTSYTDDPLAAALRAQGVDVETALEWNRLDAGRLQGVRAVILNNVPSFRLPKAFLGALDFFVRAQGSGLLMAGGKASFACGGYFGSPLADLLPVSMELRQEQRKFATALVIEIDRSGSMGMQTRDGTPKIQLASAGAARAVELLGPGDQVSVVAVDTEPHEIVPLCLVGGDGPALGNTVRRITSAGGGICVYTALKDARARLKQSPSGQRHVIVFADANDALQEVGAYKEILAEMRKEQMTVSVIGMGTDHDSGAEFLKDVAVRGDGRIFFAEDPGELPGLFEQETVAVARSAFVEEPPLLKPLAGWAELAARPLPWPKSVDGFNLSYLRPGATAAAVTADDDAAPLVAFWQRGAGRAAAVTFPLGGDFSGQVRAWAGYGDFVQTLARWAMGDATAPGVAVRAEVEGGTLSADLLFDAAWEKQLALRAPRVVLAGNGGKPGGERALVWERMEPGRYRVSAALEPGELVRGAVQIGATVLPFGPLQAGSGAEWAFDPAQPAALSAVSRASGGVERLELTGVWNAPRPPQYGDVRHWILPVVLLLFLAETLRTRLGIPLRWGAWFLRKSGAEPVPRATSVFVAPAPSRARRSAPRADAPPSAPSAPPQQPRAPEDPAAARRARFRRAKRGE